MILRGLFFGVRLGFVLLGLAVLWLGGLVVFAQRIPLQPQDLTSQTDGIVVFTGGYARLRMGFTLLHKGYAPRLLISGVHKDATLSDLVGVSKINFPVLEDQVTLDFQADDTIDNADEAAKWARAHHMKSLRLVTSNYHMPRSYLELHHELPDVKIIPHPVAAQSFRKSKWWLDREIMLNVVKEYNKFLFALMRYPVEAIEKRIKDSQ